MRRAVAPGVGRGRGVTLGAGVGVDVGVGVGGGGVGVAVGDGVGVGVGGGCRSSAALQRIALSASSRTTRAVTEVRVKDGVVPLDSGGRTCVALGDRA